MSTEPTVARKRAITIVGDTDSGMALWQDVLRIEGTRFWPPGIKHTDRDGWMMGGWSIQAAEAQLFLIGGMIGALVGSGWRIWKLDGQPGKDYIVSIANEDASAVLTKYGPSTVAALAITCASVHDREHKIA